MARFVNAQVPEVVQPFWAAMQRGEFITDAARRWAPIASRARAGWPPAVACARAAVAI